MAKLIESLALSGSRKTDGAPNASGQVWGLIVGTSTEAPLYADADGTILLLQPVVLDAAGKATIYISQAITIRVETSAGTSLGEIDVEDAPGAIAVRNPGFTGTLPGGSQGLGGVTDLDAVLTLASASFGGADFQFIESPGAAQRTIAARLREAYVSVKDWGAVGDGLVNDGAAIQAAVNRVLALGGGVVYFPPGTYLISSAITLTGGTSISFRGAGDASVIKNSSAGGNALTLANCTSFSIEQLKITHSSSGTGYAVALAGCTDFSSRGVTTAGHARAYSMTSSSARTRLVDCYIDYAASGVGVYYDSGSAHLIQGSTLVTSRGKGVSYAGTVSYSSIISTNFFGVSGAGGVSWESGLTGTYFNVVNCPSLSAFAPGLSPAFIVGISTVPIIRNVGCGLEQQGAALSLTSGGTTTPAFYQSNVWRVTGTTTGAAYIVANPSPALHANAAGTIVTFLLSNAAGGPVTGWNFDTLYKTSAATDTGANRTSAITFYWDGSVYRELSRVSTVTV